MNVSPFYKINLLFIHRINSYLLIVACLAGLRCGAQELVSDLKFNPVLRDAFFNSQNQAKHSASIQAAASFTDTISLPFVDDFSKPGIFPDDSLWINNDVFINNSIPFYPVTAGVATFDGVNHRGNPYDMTTSTSHGFADSLVSRPIHMDSLAGSALTPGDNIYLSFYYQPQGHGNAPEPEDSLVLYFKINDSTWANIWAAGGRSLNGDTAFKLVMIPVTDPVYFYSGFQFMFKNYATLSGFVDIWNLDYVKLGSNRSAADSIYNDIAFVEMSSTLLRNFQQMPWTHYQNSPSGQLKSNFYNRIGNLYSITKFFHYSYDVYDPAGSLFYSLPDAPDNIDPGTLPTSIQTNPPINFTFPAYSGDSASFLLVNKINTSPDDYRMNDTLHLTQGFYNFYSYDDGSVDNSYGLNALGGKIAYKFSPLKSDTLRGLNMYFVKMLEDVSLRTFQITIWDSVAGQPGNVMYQGELVKPMYREWLNTFYFYKFSTPLNIDISVTPTIYVGWSQNTVDLLNIGLDRNTNSQNKMFFNTTGIWYQSLIEGSWMIRPVFGEPVPDDVNIGFGAMQVPMGGKLTIYPNPANKMLHINMGGIENSGNEKISIAILNALGQVCYFSDTWKSELDISKLQEGFYFLKTSSTRGNFSGSQKFVIIR